MTDSGRDRWFPALESFLRGRKKGNLPNRTGVRASVLLLRIVALREGSFRLRWLLRISFKIGPHFCCGVRNTQPRALPVPRSGALVREDELAPILCGIPFVFARKCQALSGMLFSQFRTCFGDPFLETVLFKEPGACPSRNFDPRLLGEGLVRLWLSTCNDGARYVACRFSFFDF